MPLSISEVAKQIGLRPSAIRYYERIGILPPAYRVSGQRHYDVTILHRLTVIQRARQTGFTLGEIKELFFGFRAGTPPSVRWQRLSKRKILELDAMLEHIRSMRALVKQQGKCRCTALEECGKRMFRKSVQGHSALASNQGSPPSQVTNPISRAALGMVHSPRTHRAEGSEIRATAVPPKWRREGKQLFSSEQKNTIMAVETEGKGGGSEVGPQPTPFYRASRSESTYETTFD